MPQQQLQDNRYKFFAVGAIGTFMATLDGSILNVALPSIAEDFGAPIGLVAWVVLAYSLTLVALMMLFGAWTERRGYAFAYRFGYIFFLIGSICCALSDTIYLLIAGRVIQAIGTAMFAAVGPGMVTTVFPSHERGKGIGMMVMMVSAGFMVGPPLGGYLLGIWSWHVIFLINVPIGLIGLYMVQRYFGMLAPPVGGRKIPVIATVSISAAMLAGIFGLSFLDDYDITDPRVWGLGLASLILLGIFATQERKPERALIGAMLYKNRQFTVSLGAQLMHFAGLSGVLVLVPFYLERVRGLEPSQVGLFLVILPILMFAVSPLAGKLSDKIGYRVLTSLGMIVMGLGLWLLSRLTLVATDSYIALSLVVVGMGVGLFSTPNSSAMMGAVGEKQRAMASGILATNRNIGMSVGVALATSLFAFYQQANSALGDPKEIFVTSYRSVIYFAMAYVFVGLLLSLFRSNRVSTGE